MINISSASLSINLRPAISPGDYYDGAAREKIIARRDSHVRTYCIYIIIARTRVRIIHERRINYKMPEIQSANA